uniref:DUF547 domain-containing protein n=1 Tax=Ananas comosus var. bracteatus TaxID=296719 RepID=A0A6V7PKP9_ANACO|nr:unnamed protein product [Ananas comosus var. bracteatus]
MGHGALKSIKKFRPPLRNIFISLADSSVVYSKSSAQEKLSSSPSPTGRYSVSSYWSLSEPQTTSSWEQSPQVVSECSNELLASEGAFDPYRDREKLRWADIGNYGLATEVSWMSVGKKQLEYAAEALKEFRSRIEQLGEVNPVQLNHEERLAFWINLYNALTMHNYLAYGVPRSDMKLFSLMQKEQMAFAAGVPPSAVRTTTTTATPVVPRHHHRHHHRRPNLHPFISPLPAPARWPSPRRRTSPPSTPPRPSPRPPWPSPRPPWPLLPPLRSPLPTPGGGERERGGLR